MKEKIIESLPQSLLITGQWQTRIVTVDGKQLLPSASQKVINHSPDGFNWSYNGSGPAQLALAILLKYLPKEDACSLYQSFKVNVVSTWPKSDFTVMLNLREEIEKIAVQNESY